MALAYFTILTMIWNKPQPPPCLQEYSIPHGNAAIPTVLPCNLQPPQIRATSSIDGNTTIMLSGHVNVEKCKQIKSPPPLQPDMEKVSNSLAVLAEKSRKKA